MSEAPDPAPTSPGRTGAGSIPGSLAFEQMDTPVDRDPGIESQMLLARARRRLLGRDPTPLRIGRYEIVERVGSGGMGIVYAARDPDLGRKVALKVLRSALDRESHHRSRLIREAQALARLSHPNVVHVYEVGRHEGQVFVSMEFVQGQTLRRWTREHAPAWPEILRLFVEAGRGLLAAHLAGVVHRDFKPDNVLVGEDGRARVMDFGLARPSFDPEAVPSQESGESSSGWEAPTAEHVVEVPMTMTGTVMGTPAYMDPEQLLGAPADAFSDQYAFCVSLFEGLYGERPYQGSTVTELLGHMGRRVPVDVDVRGRGVPRKVHRAIQRGLAFERSARFPSFAELLAVLEEALRVRVGRRYLPWSLAVATVGLAAGLSAAVGPEPSSPSDAVVNGQPSHPWDAIVAASDLPDPVPTPLPEDPTGTTVHRLRNGLTVYVVPKPEEPKIAVRVVVRAGVASDPPGGEGVADLTRDALFGGGPRIGVADPERESPFVARQHEALRAMESATTAAERDRLARAADEAFRQSAPFLAPADYGFVASRVGAGGNHQSLGFADGTDWCSHVPSPRFEPWIRLQAELLIEPSFRGMTQVASSWLETQRYVYEGMGEQMTMERMLAEVFGRGRDADAEFDTVGRVPLSQVVAFHRTHYRPNNVALILVGDITPERAMPVIEEAFGNWEPAPIPEPAVLRDRPWPGERHFARVRGAMTGVWVGLNLPPANDGTRPAIEALATLLAGPHGLLADAADRNPAMTDVGLVLLDRGLVLAAAPTEGATHAEVEGILLDVLERVARQEIDEVTWSRALARVPLDAVGWSRSLDDLTEVMTASYLHHRQWPEVARSLAPSPPHRSVLASVAARLLGRGTAVVYLEPGEPWTPPAVSLPFAPVLPREFSEVHSEHAEMLADLPASEVEPRFLSEGLHFHRAQWGEAPVITAPSPGPLFRLSVVYPVGLADDPFVCAAARYRTAGWRNERGAVAGSDADVECGAGETTFHFTSVHEQFDALWGDVWHRLADTELDEALVAEQVETELRWRAEIRRDPTALYEALHGYAVRGPHSLQRLMPDDRQLAAAPMSRFEDSLRGLGAFTPQVLYSGPDPARIESRLPPTDKPARRVMRPAIVAPDEPTVFLLDLPGAEQADVRVSLVWPHDVPRDRLLADLYLCHPPPGSEHAARVQAIVYDPQAQSELDPSRLAHYSWGYRGGHGRILEVVAQVIDDVRRGPDRARFAEAREDLLARYRVERVPRMDVPGYVRRWEQDIDPRIVRWTELGRLQPTDFADFAGRVGATSPVITIVADRSRLDERQLRRLGRVHLVGPADLVRDVALTDAGFGAP